MIWKPTRRRRHWPSARVTRSSKAECRQPFEALPRLTAPMSRSPTVGWRRHSLNLTTYPCVQTGRRPSPARDRGLRKESKRGRISMKTSYGPAQQSEEVCDGRTRTGGLSRSRRPRITAITCRLNTRYGGWHGSGPEGGGKAGAGKNILVMPPFPTAFNEASQGFSGVIWIEPETLISFITDITKSLAHHGFRRILLLNSQWNRTSALSIWPRARPSFIRSVVRVGVLLDLLAPKGDQNAIRKSELAGIRARRRIRGAMY